MRLLWALVHALQKSSKRMFGTYGVTGPQRLALRVVGLFPGISAGDLAEVLHVHPSTLTGIIARLSAQGLLLRDAHTRDRRRSVLQLTSRGVRVNSVRDGTVESTVGTALERLSEEDRTATRTTLSLLAGELERNSGRTQRRQVAMPLKRRARQR